MDTQVIYELIIEHGRSERHYWRYLWRYCELFQVLAWREIAVRYKQTGIGATWALIGPFLTMVVFNVVFGKLVRSFQRAGTFSSTCGADKWR